MICFTLLAIAVLCAITLHAKSAKRLAETRKLTFYTYKRRNERLY